LVNYQDKSLRWLALKGPQQGHSKTGCCDAKRRRWAQPRRQVGTVL